MIDHAQMIRDAGYEPEVIWVDNAEARRILLATFCSAEEANRAFPPEHDGQFIQLTQPKLESDMTHVFDGAPDARQSDRVDEPLSRFRPRYRALSEDEKALHDAIKAKAVELEELITSVKGGAPTRYKSLAMTELELAIMWAVKELTA